MKSINFSLNWVKKQVINRPIDKEMMKFNEMNLFCAINVSFSNWPSIIVVRYVAVATLFKFTHSFTWPLILPSRQIIYPFTFIYLGSICEAEASRSGSLNTKVLTILLIALIWFHILLALLYFSFIHLFLRVGFKIQLFSRAKLLLDSLDGLVLHIFMWNVVLLIVFILKIWFGYQLVKILFQVALVFLPFQFQLPLLLF